MAENMNVTTKTNFFSVFLECHTIVTEVGLVSKTTAADARQPFFNYTCAAASLSVS